MIIKSGSTPCSAWSCAVFFFNVRYFDLKLWRFFSLFYFPSSLWFALWDIPQTYFFLLLTLLDFGASSSKYCSLNSEFLSSSWGTNKWPELVFILPSFCLCSPIFLNRLDWGFFVVLLHMNTQKLIFVHPKSALVTMNLVLCTLFWGLFLSGIFSHPMVILFNMHSQ